MFIHQAVVVQDRIVNFAGFAENLQKFLFLFRGVEHIRTGDATVDDVVISSHIESGASCHGFLMGIGMEAV